MHHRTRSGRSGKGCVRPQMGHKTPLFTTAAAQRIFVFGLGVRLLRCAEISERAERQEFPPELETDAHRRRAKSWEPPWGVDLFCDAINAAIDVLDAAREVSYRPTSAETGYLTLAAKIHTAECRTRTLFQCARSAWMETRCHQFYQCGDRGSVLSHRPTATADFPFMALLSSVKVWMDATSTKKNVIRSSRPGEVRNSCSQLTRAVGSLMNILRKMPSSEFSGQICDATHSKNALFLPFAKWWFPFFGGKTRAFSCSKSVTFYIILQTNFGKILGHFI